MRTEFGSDRGDLLVEMRSKLCTYVDEAVTFESEHDGRRKVEFARKETFETIDRTDIAGPYFNFAIQACICSTKEIAARNCAQQFGRLLQRVNEVRHIPIGCGLLYLEGNHRHAKTQIYAEHIDVNL